MPPLQTLWSQILCEHCDLDRGIKASVNPVISNPVWTLCEICDLEPSANPVISIHCEHCSQWWYIEITVFTVVDLEFFRFRFRDLFKKLLFWRYIIKHFLVFFYSDYYHDFSNVYRFRLKVLINFPTLLKFNWKWYILNWVLIYESSK